MPELPEVEVARRAIEEHCVGKRIVRCSVADNPKCARISFAVLVGYICCLQTGDLEGIEKYSKRTVKVFAVASEDMDTLTFEAPRFLRHLMDPSSKKISVMEFKVSKVLEELRLTMDQFIDLCILSNVIIVIALKIYVNKSNSGILEMSVVLELLYIRPMQNHGIACIA
ncbi:hypothetical protein ZIOFF_007464 [Zingiber officinale]|uniref:Formamidopyrimidine-DNA glycosylase catalytic domain-containing protein n=1 Tax=Zingiber officinale TaxID=94328 RepID=A0A8J5I1W5_ZINOF|nr:hypothetical protein ZIOFF_007464 [Zingiber officinale]